MKRQTIWALIIWSLCDNPQKRHKKEIGEQQEPGKEMGWDKTTTVHKVRNLTQRSSKVRKVPRRCNTVSSRCGTLAEVIVLKTLFVPSEFRQAISSSSRRSRIQSPSFLSPFPKESPIRF
ncbi:hypothetical protein EVAR_72931_1 [Eumeta japonica]|uniref:Uncharacterized protein n=1 Tax=Eumeta variegata TaxID=151549 RepID=A0A4C1SIG9_EUMVA|nr:hypothetical protein EVAR_72931_1 [Eumeta japonica]